LETDVSGDRHAVDSSDHRELTGWGIMGRSNSAALDGRPVRFTLSTFILRQITGLAGFLIFFLLALAIAALATWNVMDPSYSYATSNAPTNILGASGAIFADVVMQSLGLSSVLAMLPVVAWGLALVSGRHLHRLPARFGAWVAGSVLAAASVGCFPAPLTWPIPNGIGGVIGDMILRFPALFVGAYPSGIYGIVLGCIFAVPAAWCMLFAAGITGKVDDDFDYDDEDETDIPSRMRSVGDDEDDDEPRFLAFGVVIHMWYNAKARMRRMFGMGPRQRRDHSFDAPYDFNDDEFGRLNEPTRAKARWKACSTISASRARSSRPIPARS
jgi:S-DNA-T family DNA segregation ATPase FtsK/SpoIIIE